MKTANHLQTGAAVATVVVGVAAAIVPSVALGQTGHPACRTSQLSVWRGAPGDGTAGSVYYQLQFSNVSTSTCSLSGYPGISAVTSRGSQVGNPAGRDRRFSPSTVTLPPGSTAHVVLRVIDVANFPSAACQPTTAAALKIFPPGQTTAKTLQFRFRACANRGTTYMYVRTIRPRAGIPGYSQ